MVKDAETEKIERLSLGFIFGYGEVKGFDSVEILVNSWCEHDWIAFPHESRRGQNQHPWRGLCDLRSYYIVGCVPLLKSPREDRQGIASWCWDLFAAPLPIFSLVSGGCDRKEHENIWLCRNPFDGLFAERRAAPTSSSSQGSGETSENKSEKIFEMQAEAKMRRFLIFVEPLLRAWEKAGESRSHLEFCQRPVSLLNSLTLVSTWPQDEDGKASLMYLKRKLPFPLDFSP